MCDPIMIDFFLYHVPCTNSETGIIAKFIIWQTWFCLFSIPDNHKTQYIDGLYRLGGGGLQNSIKRL